MTQRTIRCQWCGGDVEIPDNDRQPPGKTGAPYRSSPVQDQVLSPGTRVIGQWTNKQWYPGTVDETRGELLHITFDDGDRLWAERDDLSTEEEPPDPEAASWEVGTKVSGKWNNGRWYRGRLDKRFGRVWRVQFNDGDRGWLETSSIRVAGREHSSPTAMALWTNGMWYRGEIDRGHHGLLHIIFDDGDQLWTEPSKVTRSTDQPDDQGGKLKVHQTVTAQWGKGSWYPGQIDRQFGRLWHVKFDDGDEAWLEASKIQLR